MIRPDEIPEPTPATDAELELAADDAIRHALAADHWPAPVPRLRRRVDPAVVERVAAVYRRAGWRILPRTSAASRDLFSIQPPLEPTCAEAEQILAQLSHVRILVAEWAESRDDQRLDSVIVHLQQAVSAVRRARGEPGSSEPYESSPAGMADAHADGQHAESPREGCPECRDQYGRAP